jgi:uncharacterized protein involved in type VI secretion and phage assembly
MPSSFDPRALGPDPGSDLFHLTLDGYPAGHFHVESLAGRETLSEPWRFDVVVTVDGTTEEDVERLVLGRSAGLCWNVGKGERAFYGVVAAVQLERVHAASTRYVQYHLRLVPRLWVLKRRRRTRIFQNTSVPEIAAAVLGEAGIGRAEPARASPPRRWKGPRGDRPREHPSGRLGPGARHADHPDRGTRRRRSTSRAGAR